MGLMDMFRPKYKHSDSSVRQDAVKELTDEQILIDIAENDEHKFVREAAVENPNLKNEKVLIEIARNDKCEYVRYSAIDKITNQEVLAEIASEKSRGSTINSSHDGLHAIENPNLTDNQLLSNIIKSEEVSQMVLNVAPKKISDEKILKDLYIEFNNSNEYKFVKKREAIVLAISDKELLVDIAKNDNNEDVRKNAIKTVRNKYPDLLITKDELFEINDEEKLIDIAKNNLDAEIRSLAVGMISDEQVLIDIIKTDRDMGVVNEAIKNSHLTNQDILSEIASDFEYSKYGFFARLNAIPKLKNDELLSKIVLDDKDSQLRYLAVTNPNLQNKEVLKILAQGDDVWHTRNDYDRDIYYSISEVAQNKLKNVN